jgi:hypothetical protein
MNALTMEYDGTFLSLVSEIILFYLFIFYYYLFNIPRLRASVLLERVALTQG